MRIGSGSREEKEYEADPDSLANVLALTLSMRGEGTISEAAWGENTGTDGADRRTVGTTGNIKTGV